VIEGEGLGGFARRLTTNSVIGGLFLSSTIFFRGIRPGRLGRGLRRPVAENPDPDGCLLANVGRNIDSPPIGKQHITSNHPKPATFAATALDDKSGAHRKASR